MATTTATTEMTIDQAWEQVAEWTEAGYRVFWKRDEAIYTLFLVTSGAPFPLEVASTDREDLRVIDCVQRMTRLLAHQQQ